MNFDTILQILQLLEKLIGHGNKFPNLQAQAFAELDKHELEAWKLNDEAAKKAKAEADAKAKKEADAAAKKADDDAKAAAKQEKAHA
jgi:hypothetical protein